MSQRAVLATFGLVSMVGTQANSVTAAEAGCQASAQEYWEAFRTIALQQEPSTLATMSKFPFAVRGALDDSDKREVTREQFATIVPVLLETDPGVSPRPTTMKELLRTTTRLPPSSCNTSGNQFRVGAWVFQLTAEGWRFVQAIVEE